MDLTLNDEQEALRDAVARLLAKESGPEQVREAEPGGFSPVVWDGLAGMGLFAMGAPEAAGGGGASLADLAVVAAQAGAWLAPAPVVEAMVAARLLGSLGEPVDDETVRTIAVRPVAAGPIGRRLTLVPGGAVAAQVLALDGDDLVVAHLPAGTATPVANLGTAPLADVDLDAEGVEVRTLATGDAAQAAFTTALDEWRALTAVWLIGLGRRAQEIGITYTIEREQFGVPIGSFQAVQHRLADLQTGLDGIGLVVDKAVWALDTGRADAAQWASMAFSAAGDIAQQAAASALHYHGGYGFMEEYDVQLYFRRAKAARLVLGDPRRELQVLADRLFGPVETTDQRPGTSAGGAR